MKIRVDVCTKMRYSAVVEADTEEEAVRSVTLDALLQERYDYDDAQEVEWEIVDDSTPVTIDKEQASRVTMIKRRVAELKEIDRIMEDDCS